MVPRSKIVTVLSLVVLTAACDTPSSVKEPTTTLVLDTTVVTESTQPASAPTSDDASTDLPSLEWMVSYGGSGFDYATAVATSSTGDIWVAADYRSPDSNNGDLVLVSLTATGELRFGKVWGGPNEDGPLRNTLATDADGGAFVGVAIYDKTTKERDLAVLRFDAAGELIWQKIGLGVAGEQRPHAVLVDQSGRIYVVGHDESDERHRILMMKLDGDGQVIWQKALAGDGSVESAYAATLDRDGNLIMVGNVGNAGEVDAFVVKVDPDGVVLWQKKWGAPGQPERAVDVVTDDEGNVYVSGPVVGQGQGGDSAFILKLSGDGSLHWEGTWTVAANEVWAHGADFDESGILILSGFIRHVTVDDASLPTSGFLLGVSPGGELLWQAAVGSDMKESIEGLVSSGDGAIVAVGQGARVEPLVIRLTGDLLMTELGLDDAYLIPVAASIPLVNGSLEVTDAGGRLGGDDDADVIVMRLTLP